MVKKNPDGTFDVICETCNGKLSDYLLPHKYLVNTADKASELAWSNGFNTTLTRCSYCV